MEKSKKEEKSEKDEKSEKEEKSEKDKKKPEKEYMTTKRRNKMINVKIKMKHSPQNVVFNGTRVPSLI